MGGNVCAVADFMLNCESWFNSAFISESSDYHDCVLYNTVFLHGNVLSFVFAVDSMLNHEFRFYTVFISESSDGHFRVRSFWRGHG